MMVNELLLSGLRQMMKRYNEPGAFSHGEIISRHKSNSARMDRPCGMPRSLELSQLQMLEICLTCLTY